VEEPKDRRAKETVVEKNKTEPREQVATGRPDRRARGRERWQTDGKKAGPPGRSLSRLQARPAAASGQATHRRCSERLLHLSQAGPGGEAGMAAVSHDASQKSSLKEAEGVDEEVRGVEDLEQPTRRSGRLKRRPTASAAALPEPAVGHRAKERRVVAAAPRPLALARLGSHLTPGPEDTVAEAVSPGAKRRPLALSAGSQPLALALGRRSLALARLGSHLTPGLADAVAEAVSPGARRRPWGGGR
jgi:hypothetical protein